MNIAIIPARSGSKRIKDKNIRDIATKPLIYWSMKAAEEAKCIDKTFVSTDSHDYITILKGINTLSGFKNTYPIIRKIQYATARAQLEEFMIPLLRKNKCSNVILLQPTSPVRLPGTIDKAYAYFKEQKADSLVSVGKIKSFIWRDGEPNYNPEKRPRSQEYNSGLCFETGSIYITSYKAFLEHTNRLAGKIVTFEMQPEELFEIDDELDFVICDAILRNLTKD